MCFVRADKAESQGEHLAQGIHGSERDSGGSLSLRTSPGSRLTTGEMRLGGCFRFNYGGCGVVETGASSDIATEQTSTESARPRGGGGGERCCDFSLTVWKKGSLGETYALSSILSVVVVVERGTLSANCRVQQGGSDCGRG